MPNDFMSKACKITDMIPVSVQYVVNTVTVMAMGIDNIRLESTTSILTSNVSGCFFLFFSYTVLQQPRSLVISLNLGTRDFEDNCQPSLKEINAMKAIRVMRM